MDWTPPGEFDEYRLLRLLGRGGMGSVWLAEDRLLDRLVAVKWIAHEAPGARNRERFAVEARAVARLQHVNVVTVHRFGEAQGRPYLVSEYIRGESLDQLAKPVSWERALELGASLACGLAAAHRHGIVHRDIKPANAILSSDGDVKLVDFGIAKVEGQAALAADDSAAAGGDGHTRPGAIIGTPRYLAPEVRAGEPATRRSDVYQLGCVLYELCTGRAPLEDLMAEAPPTVSAAVETAPLPRAAGPILEVPSLAGRLPAAAARFAAAIDRSLARAPERRFASGGELYEALEQLRAPAPAGAGVYGGNPYRGLVAFDAEHRSVFFGRGAEIRAVTDRLRNDGFVLVTGDSGVGKSSLCRAGVLPAFVERDAWAAVTLVPGARPMTALIAALAAELAVPEPTLAALRDEPTAFVRELRRARGTGGGIVVFVDQLEELITIADRAEASAAAAVLAELAAGVPGLRLLATVRSDFLTRLAELPAIGREIGRAIFLLGPLSAAGVREAIVGPAQATGVRFESEALIDELAAVTSLPLLEFTLAELWEARDPDTATITAKSLAAIGGARGALAGHADRVLEGLLPHQRAVARRLLLRLVTAERTRARRSAAELADLDRAALDALVRARLVVARSSDDEPTFELAHEGLIDGWPRLAEWLSASVETRAVLARVTAAVEEWERRQRAADALWNARQLAALAGVSEDELTPAQTGFVGASRRAVRRRRVLRIGAAALVPLAVVGFYVGARLIARRDLDARIARKQAEVQPLLAAARAARDTGGRVAVDAFARFDEGAHEPGEALWTEARTANAAAEGGYAAAAATLEAALLLDTSNASVRRTLAEVTYERMMLARREYRDDDARELATRLTIYDTSGAYRGRVSRPASLQVFSDPPEAQLALIDGGGERPLSARAELAPGMHTLIARAAGRATVRHPIVVQPGEPQQVQLRLPLAHQVPDGFVYIPRGRFATGSRDADPIRRFFIAAPMHEVETEAYLIGATEVTYAQWIEFLEDQTPAEREVRMPRIEGANTVQANGALELMRASDGSYELRIMPGGVEYRARAGEMIEYRDRTRRARQDWRRFPVAAISADDAAAYTAWLDRTRRVPGARTCTELEWERAARGVDGRAYPHGDRLEPDDANVDITYGRKDAAFGPDEVGSHPVSNSVYGLADTAGNVWEYTRALDGSYVIRGSAYYIHPDSAHLANRQPMPSGFRSLHIGARVCADAPR